MKEKMNGVVLFSPKESEISVPHFTLIFRNVKITLIVYVKMLKITRTNVFGGLIRSII